MYYSESYEPLHFAWDTLAIAEHEATEQPSSVILKASWQVEQRKTIEADVFRKLDGAFGTAKYWYCAQPLNAGGSKPVSNIAFLPNDKEIDSCFWNVFSKKPPKAAERRYLVLTLLATEGKQFTHAKTAEDLVDYFMHSVLGMLSSKIPISLSPTTAHQGGGPFIKLASCTVTSASATYSWLRNHLSAKGRFLLRLKNSSGTQPLNLRRLHFP